MFYIVVINKLIIKIQTTKLKLIYLIGTCVAFTYLWHVTFFGACMAIAGYAEKDNRHALSCFKVVPKSQASKSFFDFSSNRYSNMKIMI